MHHAARELHGSSLRLPSCRFKSHSNYFKSYNFLLESIRISYFFKSSFDYFTPSTSLGHFDIKLRLRMQRTRNRKKVLPRSRAAPVQHGISSLSGTVPKGPRRKYPQLSRAARNKSLSKNPTDFRASPRKENHEHPRFCQ